MNRLFHVKRVIFAPSWKYVWLIQDAFGHRVAWGWIVSPALRKGCLHQPSFVPQPCLHRCTCRLVCRFFSDEIAQIGNLALGAAQPPLPHWSQLSVGQDSLARPLAALEDISRFRVSVSFISPCAKVRCTDLTLSYGLVARAKRLVFQSLYCDLNSGAVSAW